MKKFLRCCAGVVLTSFLVTLLFPTVANADSVAPEIISVKASSSTVYVGKKWTDIRFEVVANDQSTNVKLSKIFLKSINAQSKNISCFDAESIEKTISGNQFAHQIVINCALPKNTEAPDIRFIQFTASDTSGLTYSYDNDIFSARINLVFGFDPKVIESSQSDAGKLRLVEDCISYEQQRFGAMELYKDVAKFPAGNPFEVRYKEAKTAFAKPFNCELGADLLTRVSDYEDSIKRLSIGLGEFVSYQHNLIFEKMAPAKKVSITCVKGKLSKVVKGSNPKCPKGYKKK